MEKAIFDGLEIGTASRQVWELRAAGGEGLRHAGDFVRGEIIAEHQVPMLELRSEHPLDVNHEHGALHRAIDEAGSAPPVLEQGCSAMASPC